MTEDTNLMVKRLLDALIFYADPDTYFGIGFMPDPPCGEFTDDVSETGLGNKPGKLARETLKQFLKDVEPYDKIDEHGIFWRSSEGKPVSQLADAVMAPLEERKIFDIDNLKNPCMEIPAPRGTCDGRDRCKLGDYRTLIIRELEKLLKTFNAPIRVLSLLGSLDDTLEDFIIYEQLRDYIAGYKTPKCELCPRRKTGCKHKCGGRRCLSALKKIEDESEAFKKMVSEVFGEKNELNEHAKCPNCGNVESRRTLNALQQCPVCKVDYSNFVQSQDERRQDESPDKS